MAVGTATPKVRTEKTAPAMSEDVLLGVDRDDLALHPKGREDHDVDRGVGVEPEEVLEEHRIAPDRRVEDADPEGPLQPEEEERDGQHRGRQDLYDGGGVEGPEEQRHAVPGETRRPHLVHGNDEVHARENGRETEDEGADERRDDTGIRRDGVGDVEGPARVQTARDDGVEEDHRACDVEVERGQIQAREGDVLGADHQGQEEVAQHGRDRRDDHQEDHDRPVEGEELVVGIAIDQVGLGREELDAHGQRDEPSDQEEDDDGREVEQTDPLVIEGEEPAPDPAGGVQVVVLGRGDGGRVCRRAHGAHLDPSWPSPWPPSSAPRVLRYSMMASMLASLHRPLKVGISGPKPATSLACGSMMDSRM